MASYGNNPSPQGSAPAGNPSLTQLLRQYQALLSLGGGFTPDLPAGIGDPLRVQTSGAGDIDSLRLIEQLMGRRPPTPMTAPQQSREQQQPYGNPKPAPGFGGLNPFSILEQNAFR